MEKTVSKLQIEAAAWPGIMSRFQLVILAGLRSKQLLRGAKPRILADPLKRKNTSIALEELKQGLIPFRGQKEYQAGLMEHIHEDAGPIVVRPGSGIELGTK